MRQDIVQTSADALGPVQIDSQAFTFAWPAGQLQQPGYQARPWLQKHNLESCSDLSLPVGQAIDQASAASG